MKQVAVQGGRVSRHRDYGVKFSTLSNHTEDDFMFEEDYGIVWPELVFASSSLSKKPEFNDWKDSLADFKIGPERIVRGILLSSSYLASF